jgi:nitrite reductase/ring-hydroxylating ferredoxin subunit/uncharacterized membrane protein
MNSEKILNAINEQEWLDEPTETAQSAIHGAFEAGGAAGQQIKNCLHGTWLGHQLHPAITDVPVGSWTVAAVLDVLAALGKKELNRGADVAIGVGLVGAAGSAITGMTDWSDTEGRARKVGAIHATLNIVATVLYLTSWLMRRGGDDSKRSTARCLSWTGYAISGASAWLGGALVFSEKIGVDHAPRTNWPEEWTGVMAESELQEGQFAKAEINDQEVLLARRNGQVYALANTCSHLSGPLNEGEWCGDNDEPAVRCPWHGSCFKLRDGNVIDGPATHPQPAFETRISDGQIEVRIRPETA